MNNLWRVEWDCWWTLCLQKSPIKWTGFSLYQNSHAILWYIMSYNSLLSKIKTLIKLLDPNLDNSVWKKPLRLVMHFTTHCNFCFQSSLFCGFAGILNIQKVHVEHLILIFTTVFFQFYERLRGKKVAVSNSLYNIKARIFVSYNDNLKWHHSVI